MALGSLLGGVLTQAFGWESVFFVNVPLAAVAIAFAFPLLPGSVRVPGRFDLPGAVTATGGITLLVFALVQGPASGWTSVPVLSAFVAGAGLLAGFAVIELRGPDPLMPLRLFANRHLRTGVAVTFLFAATFGPQLYFETVYFQTVHGYSALRTGLAYLVPMVAIFAGANAGGRLASRLGLRTTLALSLAIGAIGTVALGLSLSTHTSYAALVVPLLVLGLGQGSAFTTMYAAASTGVPSSYQGVASGIASTGQQIGAAVGLAVLVAVANSGTQGLTGEPLLTATVTGLRTAVLLAAAGITLTALLTVLPRSLTQTPALSRA